VPVQKLSFFINSTSTIGIEFAHQTSMKTSVKSLSQLSIVVTAALFTYGCSSLPGSTSGKDISSAGSGPTVVNARVTPSTIELNRNMQPMTPAEILADVKDFQSPVKEVKLRFLHVPLQIPMERVSGTTWRAILTPEQLQMLAVSGKTITYEATVIARDERGQTSVSQSPITVAIKAPDVSASAAG
jgi:hypothetical protein